MFRPHGMSELPGDSKSLPAQKVIDKTQWVKFNVGGCMLETTRKTVDKLQSSFLDLLLDNEIQEITNPLPEGVFRIDRDPEVFQILLNYGRYGRITGVPDHVTLEFVLQEVEFYKMSHHVKDAVLNFFEQKRKGPNGIRVESVSITETTFKRKHKHHNSYGILGGGATISCYSSIPGGGTCYADVSSLFQYEKPHSKCKSHVSHFAINVLRIIEQIYLVSNILHTQCKTGVRRMLTITKERLGSVLCLG